MIRRFPMRRPGDSARPAVGVLAMAADRFSPHAATIRTMRGPNDGTTTTEAESPGRPARRAAVVKVTDNDEFGKILTDGSGMTLYVFLKDTGTTSTCTDACADLWPAVTVTGDADGRRRRRRGSGHDDPDRRHHPGDVLRPPGLHLRRRCRGRRHDRPGSRRRLVRRRLRPARRSRRPLSSETSETTDESDPGY